MSNKPIAMLVAALLVAPLCSVCILGPAVVGGFFAGWFGWLADLSAIQVIALGSVAVALILSILRFRQSRTTETLVTEPEPRP